MNKETENRIDKLFNESGLFPSVSDLQNNKKCFDFSDEVILITGAAGSIGSGLVKTLIHCKYKKLILVDNAESPLYELIKSLEFEDLNSIHFSLTDITNKESLQHVFEAHTPSIVFHTAAYKHVPLLETNAYSAVKTNVFGSKLLADMSNEFNVEKFIFISTDKAVNPINVMGISKKIGENYLNYLNTQSNTNFIITRFGNIFGSNGSVVPLLKKQIEFGETLTITQESISRYFISKQNACKLILKLAIKPNYINTTYTFNMGEPIRIADIIERLIVKCGKAKESIQIEITGLRPGEKINETIKSNNEILIATEDEDILIVKQKEIAKNDKIDFKKLLKITPNTTNQYIKSILKSYI